MDKLLSIYVHVPFCVRKCLYCDFLSFSCDKNAIDRYFRALLNEIGICAKEYGDFEVKSIFFGGGTPSYVDEKYIVSVLAAIRERFDVCSDVEISIEANPGSATYEKLLVYRNAGINRLSIGAQSLNDNELKALGRVHDSGMFFETYKNARKAGFDNINVDVMSALPGQKLETYLDTLNKVLELKPEHISAYSLIVEEGTPFYEMELDLPDEELDREMYHETKRLLAEKGYHRYEISNYALDSYECYHNKVYWTRGNYLGIGLGASSMVGNIRWSNVRELNGYCDSLCDREEGNSPDELKEISENRDIMKIRENIETLTLEAQMEEFMFLGLRLTKGVSINEFESQFGKSIFEVYGDIIDKYISLKLLEIADQHLRLTEQGFDVSNTVMADFLLD